MPFAVTKPEDTAPLVEGEPFYTLHEYTLVDGTQRPPSEDVRREEAGVAVPPLTFCVRAFECLPPDSAVGLLSGDDATGLIVWGGALAFVEWAARRAASAGCAVRKNLCGCDEQQTAVWLELGCGTGAVSVALASLLARGKTEKRSSAPDYSLGGSDIVIATDGNEACVALAARNLAEQVPPAAAVAAGARVLLWGAAHTNSVESILRERTSAKSPAAVMILSADVIYAPEAVPLLVETVEAAAAYVRGAGVGVGGAGDSATRVEWWLLYTPRSLTRESNLAIYGALTDALAARPDWAVERSAAPAGCVDTGYEGDGGEDDVPDGLCASVFRIVIG